MSREGNMNGVYPLPDTLQSTLPGPWTWYIYDGGQLSLTATRSGNTWNIGGRQLAGGIDRPMVMRTGAGPVAIVSDRQGTFQTAVSTAGLWDQSFTVTASNLFGARDGATRGSGATGGAGFSGAGVSSSGAGFVYLRNRWYDPQSGRFLTQDPIGLAGGVNLYAYAGNNPTTFSDPFGLKVCFSGSKAQIDRLHDAAEAAVNADLSLDKSNCVSGMTSRGDTSFNRIRARFDGLVNSDQTFTAQFSSDFQSGQFDSHTINIFEHADAMGYPAMKNGKCTRDAVSADIPQVMAHELWHHYNVSVTGRMDGREMKAVGAENIYLRAAGRPERCAY